MTIVDTARLAMKSSTGAHVAPPVVVVKMPPPTLPANMVFVLTGSITSDRTRPPMLPGPSHVQPLELIPAEAADALAPLGGAGAPEASGDGARPIPLRAPAGGWPSPPGPRLAARCAFA